MAFTSNVAAATKRDLQVGQAVVLSEVVINDTSKDIVYDTDIGRGARFDISSIRVEMTTGGTAGLRTLMLTVLVGAEVICEVPAIATVSVSTTDTWQFFIGLDAETAGGILIESLPPDFFLAPGQTLRVSLANSTPAEDTMIVHVNGIVH